MAVTRINNNQITDASAGNVYLGVNAAVKLQNYTITSQKIANNLTYGSDLTISGNLQVNGTTTTIDTVNVLVKDPLITLADGQTTGTPTLDIGTIGLRGSELSAVMAWKENQLEFVTALSNTTVSNTTFNLTSYANLHTGNFIAEGTTSLVGNLIGAVNATATITGGNLATPGTASAGGNITGANVLTGGLVSATSTVTGSSLLGSVVSASGTITGGNLATGGTISSTGNITGGNVLTGGIVSATGNITGNYYFGNGSQLTGVAAESVNANALVGNTLSPNVLFSSLTSVGTLTSLSVSGNTTGGNLLTGGIVSATGNITGGNVSAGSGLIQTTGNINGGNLNATTGVRAVTGYFTGNVDVLGNLNASVGVVYANSGIFYGDAVTGNNAAFAGVPGFTPLGSNVVMQFAGNVNSYSQLNFQNINNGNHASTDFIATANNGDDTSYYLDFGINGNTFNDPTNYPGFGPNDSYVHNHGGNLILNPETSGKAINFMVGGTDTTDIIATMTATQLTVDGITSVVGNVVGGNVLTGGLISATGTITSATTITGGNLATGGTASATGNITGGNVLTGGQVSATGNVTGGNVNTNNIVGTGVTITSTGALNLAPSGNITANSKNINNLADPAQDQDAATKAYVDSVAQGLDVKASVVYATTTNLPAYTYNNGTSGVGATLTAQAVGNLTLDGTVVSSGQRVLIKNEVGAFVDNTTQSAAFNGIYVVTTAGSPSAAYVLTRATDFDNGSPSGEIPGAFTFVEHGATEADTGWVCTTNNPVTVGTTQIIFAQFSGAGSYTAGNGLSLTGTQFNVLTDGNANPTTAINGSNQVVVPAGAAFTTPNIGAATGTSLSTTGTVTGGNLATGGTISGTGNITGGNVLTGGLVSVGGGVTAASVAGGVITGTSTSVTGTQTAASTVGGVITGSSSSVTGTQTAASTVGGVITGSSASVSGTVTAASTVGGVITGSSASVTGTVTTASTVGGVITGSSVSVSGNVTAANFFGNISGNIDAAGSNTQVQFNDTGDILGASAGFTFDKTANLLTVAGNVAGGNLTTGGQVSATANITGGNVLTGGLISATGTVTGSSLLGSVVSASGTITGGNLATGGTASATGNVTGGNVLTGGLISATGTITSSTTITGGNLATGGTASAGGNITGGNILTGGLISATGNINGGNVIATAVTGGNIVISGDNITDTNGRVNFNTAGGDVDFAVNGDTVANVFYVDAGTGTASFGSATQTTNAVVAFNASNSILLPVGNIGQRPATGVTGMVRFNSTNNNLEVYDNSQWSAVGVPSFTVIADEQFNGDGSTVAFTLDTTQTTNSCIVSINGVVQIPTVAYSVAGTDPTCVLTFTEAPAAGDIIDVREITTTTTVTSISNASGNAVVAVSDTAALVNVTGDLSVTGTILGGNINSTAITNGTSNVAVASSGGNVRFNIGGTSNVVVVSNGLMAITGDLSVSGNATLSGNILGDRIQNGTTSLDIQTASGNANLTIGGTSNVVVWSTTGEYVTGLISATGNITGNYLFGNGSQLTGIDATSIQNGTSNVRVNSSGSNVTVSVGGTSNVVVWATTGEYVTGLISATGNITGGNLSVGTGTITGGNIVNSNANGVGNIGSSTTYFNTVFAKATSAQYADLAEKYVADAEYVPGTVLVFGGTHEVTVNAVDGDRKVAGVVSTNPSYIMNGGLQADHVATVALTGRVPTMVIGPVRKGDLMVAAGLGRARAEADPRVGTVIGKALEDFDGAEGTIEVVVGRF